VDIGSPAAEVPDHAGTIRVALGIGHHNILVGADAHRVIGNNHPGGAFERSPFVIVGRNRSNGKPLLKRGEGQRGCNCKANQAKTDNHRFTRCRFAHDRQEQKRDKSDSRQAEGCSRSSENNHNRASQNAKKRRAPLSVDHKQGKRREGHEMRNHSQQILVAESSTRLCNARKTLIDRIARLNAKPEHHARNQGRGPSLILADLRHGGEQKHHARQLPSVEKGSHGHTRPSHRCENNENIERQDRQERGIDSYLLVSEKHRQRHEIEQRKLKPLGKPRPHRPGDWRDDQVPGIHDKRQKAHCRPHDRRTFRVSTQP